MRKMDKVELDNKRIFFASIPLRIRFNFFRTISRELRRKHGKDKVFCPCYVKKLAYIYAVPWSLIRYAESIRP